MMILKADSHFAPCE